MTSIAPDVLFPDAELVLQAWIRGMTLGATVRVVTDLPADLDAALPVVQVTRIGGAMVHPALLDGPRMDVDVYAASRAQASEIARKIAGKVHTLRGQAGGGAVITDVREEIGVGWRPDLNDRIRRFGFVVRLILRRS